jgi:DNA repair exonuclease SbcCD ATPase subunit
MSTSNKSAKQKQKDPASAPATASKTGTTNGGLNDLVKSMYSVSQQLLQKHPTELHQIDELGREVISLQEVITERDQKITKLEASKEFFLTTVTEERQKWDAEKKKLEGDVEDKIQQYKASCAHKVADAEQKVKFAAANERDMRKILEEKKKQVDEGEAHRIGLETQLEICRAELEKLRTDVGLVEFGSDLSVGFLSPNPKAN